MIQLLIKPRVTLNLNWKHSLAQTQLNRSLPKPQFMKLITNCTIIIIEWLDKCHARWIIVTSTILNELKSLTSKYPKLFTVNSLKIRIVKNSNTQILGLIVQVKNYLFTFCSVVLDDNQFKNSNSDLKIY